MGGTEIRGGETKMLGKGEGKLGQVLCDLKSGGGTPLQTMPDGAMSDRDKLGCAFECCCLKFSEV